MTTTRTSPAALELAYVPSDQIAAQSPDWWRNVLGVVGFEQPPAIDGAPAPVTASMTPALSANGPVCEVWRVDAPEVRLSNGAARQSAVNYRFCEDLLFGSITVAERPLGQNRHGAAGGTSDALVRATELAYREIFAVLRQTEHPHLIRIWNYLPEINREADGDERYRHFNSARQLAFRNSGRATVGTVPAASALG